MWPWTSSVRCTSSRRRTLRRRKTRAFTHTSPVPPTPTTSAWCLMMWKTQCSSSLCRNMACCDQAMSWLLLTHVFPPWCHWSYVGQFNCLVVWVVHGTDNIAVLEWARAWLKKIIAVSQPCSNEDSRRATVHGILLNRSVRPLRGSIRAGEPGNFGMHNFVTAYRSSICKYKHWDQHFGCKHKPLNWWTTKTNII